MLFYSPRERALDNNGRPGDGWKLNFYKPGTSTRKDTFTTSDYDTEHANPVVSDAAGEFPAIHLLGDYKVVLMDENDVEKWTETWTSEDTADASRDNIKALTDIAASGLGGGEIVFVRAFYSNTDTGGGHFYWDAGRDKADANASTIIDPDNTGDWDGTQADYEASFVPAQGTGSGTGCWVLVEESPVLVAREALEYTIGDGTTNNTAIIPKSGSRLDGKGAKLIHNAKNAAGQSRLIDIVDADDVSVRDYEIDGESETRNGVTLAGIVRRILLKELNLHDLDNFALQYADSSTDPTEAFFEDVTFDDIKIHGTVGPAGDGSGINFFPRAAEQDFSISGVSGTFQTGETITGGSSGSTADIHQVDSTRLKVHNVSADFTDGETITGGTSGATATLDSQSGGKPVAKRLFWPTLNIDVTEGDNNRNNHGPQCLKINNTADLQGNSWMLRGGSIAACILTNGLQHFQIGEINTSKANSGLIISDVDNVNSPDAGIVKHGQIGRLIYKLDGVTNTTNEYGLQIQGGPQYISIAQYELEGEINFRLQSSDNELKNFVLGRGVIRGAPLIVDSNGVTPNNQITRFYSEFIHFDTPNNNVAADLGDGTWNFDDSEFATVYLTNSRLIGIRNRGDNDRFGHIWDHNGNTDDSAAGTAIRDEGNDTVIDLISLTGASNNTRYFFDKRDGSGLHVGAVIGIPGHDDGVTITNQTELVTTNTPPLKSKAFDLDGGADEDVIYFAARDAWLVSAQWLYTEATSGDTGIALSLEERSGGSDSELISQTSSTGAGVDTTDDYVNDGEFSARKIPAGSMLVAKSEGGKTGDGEARLIAHIVESV